MFVYCCDRSTSARPSRQEAAINLVGRNADIKRFSTSVPGQPLELFDSKRARLPVLFELLASPWIVCASALTRNDGSGATKHTEEHVNVAWDAVGQRPISFTRDGHLYRIDAIVQVWTAERVWWDSRRHVSRRFWRVVARNGVYDLAYDRARNAWCLIGIQD